MITTYIGLTIAADYPRLVSKLFSMQARNWAEEVNGLSESTEPE
jgi:hypothetical protein